MRVRLGLVAAALSVPASPVRQAGLRSGAVLCAAAGWLPEHEFFVRELFLEYMAWLLGGYDKFAPALAPADSRPLATASSGSVHLLPSAGGSEDVSNLAAIRALPTLGIGLKPALDGGWLEAAVVARGGGNRVASRAGSRGGEGAAAKAPPRRQSAMGDLLAAATRESSVSSVASAGLALARATSSRSTVAFDAAGFVAARMAEPGTGAVLAGVTQTLGLFAFLEEQKRCLVARRSTTRSWLEQARDTLRHLASAGEGAGERVLVLPRCAPHFLRPLRLAPHRCARPRRSARVAGFAAGPGREWAPRPA